MNNAHSTIFDNKAFGMVKISITTKWVGDCKQVGKYIPMNGYTMDETNNTDCYVVMVIYP